MLIMSYPILPILKVDTVFIVKCLSDLFNLGKLRNDDGNRLLKAIPHEESEKGFVSNRLPRGPSLPETLRDISVRKDSSLGFKCVVEFAKGEFLLVYKVDPGLQIRTGLVLWSVRVAQ